MTPDLRELFRLIIGMVGRMFYFSDYNIIISEIVPQISSLILVSQHESKGLLPLC